MNHQEFPQIRIDNDQKRTIFDVLRQRYVALTPEEEVRQHFIHHLITEKGYPQNLLANELNITLNGTSKRCDSVLFSPTLEPVMIIEYKAPRVQITQQVFEQILRYNIVLKVKYLVLYNGVQLVVCQIDSQNQVKILPSMPDYQDL